MSNKLALEFGLKLVKYRPARVAQWPNTYLIMQRSRVLVLLPPEGRQKLTKKCQPQEINKKLDFPGEKNHRFVNNQNLDLNHNNNANGNGNSVSGNSFSLEGVESELVNPNSNQNSNRNVTVNLAGPGVIVSPRAFVFSYNWVFSVSRVTVHKSS